MLLYTIFIRYQTYAVFNTTRYFNIHIEVN